MNLSLIWEAQGLSGKADETVSDWLMRLTGSMQSTTISRVGLRYRREYSDTGGELLYSAVTNPAFDGPEPTVFGCFDSDR